MTREEARFVVEVLCPHKPTLEGVLTEREKISQTWARYESGGNAYPESSRRAQTDWLVNHLSSKATTADTVDNFDDLLG